MWQKYLENNSELRDQLQHIYWIGGGSGAGKSTIARRIAAQYNLHYYATDDAMADHGRRSMLVDCPYMAEFRTMSMDERWVNRSPQKMLETFHWFRGEAFNMIIEDLLRLPKERGIVVEGFRLLPRLVKPLLINARQAVWILPAPTFREAVFNGRGGTAWSFIGRTSNPSKALQNLLARDALFTEVLATEVKDLNLSGIPVNSTMTEDVLFHQVLQKLGL